jgi:transposase-like protein
MRKQHSAAFKADLIVEVLKEEKTIAQLAAEHGVHPVQISQWKAAALKGLPAVFEKEGKGEATRQAAHEKEKEALYQEIGRLHAQVSWMKKKAGHVFE